MEDRELLERAARAAGLKVKLDDFMASGTETHYWLYAAVDEDGSYWNPLIEDGDALQLAVRLRLEIGLSIDGCVYAFRRHSEGCHEPLGGTPESAYAATRRAIVRAAAALEESPQ